MLSWRIQLLIYHYCNLKRVINTWWILESSKSFALTTYAIICLPLVTFLINPRSQLLLSFCLLPLSLSHTPTSPLCPSSTFPYVVYNTCWPFPIISLLTSWISTWYGPLSNAPCYYVLYLWFSRCLIEILKSYSFLRQCFVLRLKLRLKI